MKENKRSKGVDYSGSFRYSVRPTHTAGNRKAEFHRPLLRQESDTNNSENSIIVKDRTRRQRSKEPLRRSDLEIT